jgi:hypothetical protein
MMMMMGQGSDRRELERAQRELERARRNAGISDAGLRPIGGEVRDLMAAIEHARAAQDRRRDADPDLYARELASAEARELALDRQLLISQGWPEGVAEEVLAGADRDGNHFTEQEHERWLAEGLAKGSRLLVLHGWYGTGKTIGACRVLHGLPPERGVMFLSAHRIRSLSRASHDQATLDRWEEFHGIIAVDEIADDEETADQSKRIAGWLQRRWERGLQTVAITNRRWKEIEGRPGKGDGIWPQALLSRIYQSGGVKRCKTILRSGEKIRQKKES